MFRNETLQAVDASFRRLWERGRFAEIGQAVTKDARQSFTLVAKHASSIAIVLMPVAGAALGIYNYSVSANVPAGDYRNSLVPPAVTVPATQLPYEYQTAPEFRLSSGEYQRLAFALLTEKGLNMIEKSFAEIMTEKGYAYGFMPLDESEFLRVKDGKQVELQTLPAPLEASRFIGNMAVTTFQEKENLTSHAILSLFDPQTGLLRIYVLTSPWDIIKLPVDRQDQDSPNVIKGHLVRPGWAQIAVANLSDQSIDYKNVHVPANFDTILKGYLFPQNPVREPSTKIV